LAHSPHPPDEVLGWCRPGSGPPRWSRSQSMRCWLGLLPSPSLWCCGRSKVYSPRISPRSPSRPRHRERTRWLSSMTQSDRLGIDYQGGCWGSRWRGSSTIGRAVSLVLRNVGGQRANATTKSVSASRPSGWSLLRRVEERSPWPSLAERRGFDKGDEVVSVHAAIGTHAMYDDHNTEAEAKAYMLAKGMCYLCNSCIQSGSPTGEFVLLINPVHANGWASDSRDIADLQQCLWENAWQPISVFLQTSRPSWPMARHHRRRQGPFGGATRADHPGGVRRIGQPPERVVEQLRALAHAERSR